MGPLPPKAQRFAFESCDLGCLLRENFISSHQPAHCARGAAAGVSREPGNGPGTEAVMLRGYFENVHAKDVSIYPREGGEESIFKASS